jgi:ribosome-associated protein
MNKATRPMRGVPLLQAIAGAAFDKKADDVTVLDLGLENGIADWFIICQGDNAMHNMAIAGNIRDDLEKRGMRPWHTEGEADGRWIVMDFSDVVVHVMTPQVRSYYCLEELWKPIAIKDIEKRSYE